MGTLERRFGLTAAGTSARTEVLAGATTFLTLSYILLVQPAIMGLAGIPPATAYFATCVGSAFACLAMGLLANLPIALAPAMGHNVFFSLTACAPVAAGGLGLTWQQGLAAVFLSGSLFVALAAVRFRERVVDAIPDDLKHAIAAGIGLLIALVGLEWGGLVRDHPVTLVRLGDLAAPTSLLALFGLALTTVLLAARVRAALLLGITATVGAGMAVGLVPVPDAIVSTDVGADLVLDDLDFAGLLGSERVFEVLFVLFFLDLFDTVGTLVGVSARAGLMKDGKLPRVGRALLSDASGTVVGASLGTSTITSYVESAAGVAAGGRTGLTSIVVAALFLVALPLAPLARVVGEAVVVDGLELRPALAPALIVVGASMARSVSRIDWEDAGVAIPCFLTMVVMPLSFSITDGIAFGFVGLSLVALLTRRRLGVLFHVLALAFVARFVFFT